MSKVIQFCLILISSMAMAFDVSRSKEHLFLNDPNCNEAPDIVRALINWEKINHSEKTCPLDPDRLAVKKSPVETSKNCRYDITKCVPEHVAQFQSQNPKESGPNCWNLSLVMKGILPGLRYSSPDEMHYYMRPPLCQQLKNGDQRRPGDVGAIRELDPVTNKVTEYHGFIYISDKIAYSKNGYAKASPYSLQSLENVYKVYGVKNQESCRQNEIDPKSGCPTAVSYFRCKSMTQYLSETPNIPNEIKTTFAKFDTYEHCLQKKLMQGGAISAEAHKNLKDASAGLLQYLENQRLDNDNISGTKNEEKDFLLGSLQLRLQTLGEQLSMAGHSMEAIEIGTFSSQFREASKDLDLQNNSTQNKQEQL